MIPGEVAEQQAPASPARARRPRVLIIGPTPPPYHGVAVATETLVAACRSRGIAIRHLDISDRRGIQHVDQPDFHDVLLFVRQWFELVWRLAIERPGLVYLSISQSTIGFLRDSLFVVLARVFRARVVIHLHGGNFRAWYDARSSLMQRLVRYVLSLVAAFVILGETFRCSFEGIIEPRKLRVVPNGIDWPGHDGIAPRKRARRRILYLGTLSKAKGAIVLLQSVAQVASKFPNIEFVFAGRWLRESDRAEAQALLHDLRTAVAAKFVGEVAGAQKRTLFESSDIFVFPGLQQEGQPLVVIEAMAAGLPVIFTDRGCLKETVVEGVTGLEVPASDPQRLAEKLLWLLEQPQLMQTMGEQARRRYEELYSRHRFMENMTNLFEEIAGESR